MSEHGFERSAGVAASAESVRRFFADGDALFRLNPEWEVLACKAGKLKVRYERSEAEADYCRPHAVGETADCRTASADFALTGGELVLDGAPPRRIRIALTEIDPGRTRVDWQEDFDAPVEDARRAELNLWFDAALGYLSIAERTDRRGRFMHWLLDRIWLKMSPTGRRVGLLIVGMEALALLLFVAVLIVYRLLG